jgi:disintegrin and metalloproteinase domain-containing protein 17
MPTFFLILIEHENFHDGRLFGEISSEASVHLEDGAMTPTIYAPEETYLIEVMTCFTVILC